MLPFIIIVITCLISIACALPGIFLVLRGTAMMSDAISHALLPGIVLMFLYTHNLQSPLLILGASLSGIATVLLAQAIIHANKLKKDAAIGLIYPLFFSVGVILINVLTRNIHLDIDIVLLGDLALAPLHRSVIWGIDFGPSALLTSATLALINSIIVYLLYKELALSTFDWQYAHTIGYRPDYIHHLLMIMTSITAVVAFDIVGSIVVIALMITPAATAFLMTHKLSTLILYTLMLSILSALLGYVIASWLDISIAGTIATITGTLFFTVLGIQQIFAHIKR